MFVLRSSKAHAAGRAGPQCPLSLALLRCLSSIVGQTEWEGPDGRVDKPFHSLIQAEAGDGFLMPFSVLRRARACGKELVINLCVTLFVNGDKKKDRLRRMRRWRLLHCFNLSQYITAWLASKKSKPSILGRQALGHLSSFWRASADFYVQLFGTHFLHRALHLVMMHK